MKLFHINNVPCFIGILISSLFLTGCEDPPPGEYYPVQETPVVGGNAKFLATCNENLDCLDRLCLNWGGAKKCSKKCVGSATCPAFNGWSCDAESVCQCTPNSNPATGCNTDNDCDGKVDTLPQTETCNGLDDDCNGIVDDVAANTAGAQKFYQDLDGDNVGDTTKPAWRCQAEAGWVAQSGDCNDDDKTIYFGAPELCNDNKDNNCDLQIDEAAVCGVSPTTVASVTDELSSSVKLGSCTVGGGVTANLDLIEIDGKQDASNIKFTVRLTGAPERDTCAVYKLLIGDGTKFDMVYLYRPASQSVCGASIGLKKYFLEGVATTTSAQMNMLVATPGHVSFIIPKSEMQNRITTTTYYVKACAASSLAADKEALNCPQDGSVDVCQIPVKK